MNCKQAKRARGLAMREAKRSNLWGRMTDRLIGTWWRKLIAKLFPKAKARYLAPMGWWYKRVVKQTAKQAYRDMHDPDRKAFEASRKRIMRRRAAKQMREAEERYAREHPEPVSR